MHSKTCLALYLSYRITCHFNILSKIASITTCNFIFFSDFVIERCLHNGTFNKFFEEDLKFLVGKEGCSGSLMS